MVYCGKPSKSCAPCRFKRTRCDLKLPSCSQCIRTGRLCSGYRDLPFHDRNRVSKSEQEVQETLVYSTSSALGPSHAPPQLHLKHISSSHTKANSINISIPQGLRPSLEDSAASLFFNYFLPLTHSNPGSLFFVLPQLYARAPANSTFASTITALGLICLANRLRVPRIMVRASKEYAKVLGKINKVISDPIQAKEDQTVLIVMLLGLYEQYNTTSRSMDPWTSHVTGALALVELRGEEQLHRSMSRQILRMLRVQVLGNCLVRRSAVPESIIRWSELAQEFEDSYELLAENELAVACARFCNLQASIESQGKGTNLEEILECALGLDARLVRWVEKWSVINPFEKLPATVGSPYVFSDHYHLYSNHLIASHWNNYRSVRIELHRLIGHQYSLLPGSTSSPAIPAQISISGRIVMNLGHEICASIPYFMANSNSEFVFSQNTSAQTQYQLRNTAHARLVIWPLFVLGKSPFVSDGMRLYAAEQLESIGSGMGIRKAQALGQLVRVKQQAMWTNWRDIGMWDK